jgi:hypothetical protein
MASRAVGSSYPSSPCGKCYQTVTTNSFQHSENIAKMVKWHRTSMNKWNHNN